MSVSQNLTQAVRPPPSTLPNEGLGDIGGDLSRGLLGGTARGPESAPTLDLSIPIPAPADDGSLDVGEAVMVASGLGDVADATIEDGEFCAVEPGSRRLGPRARALVMWVKEPVVLVLRSLPSDCWPSENVDEATLALRPLPVVLAADGGPRASKLARPGLKRPDSPAGALLDALELFTGRLGWPWRLKLCRAIDSGAMTPRSFAVVGLLVDLDRLSCLAMASGGVASGSLAPLLDLEPLPVIASPALAFMASFCLSMLSLKSSRRSVFLGPPVTVRPALPRRILFFNSSGAT